MPRASGNANVRLSRAFTTQQYQRAYRSDVQNAAATANDTTKPVSSARLVMVPDFEAGEVTGVGAICDEALGPLAGSALFAPSIARMIHDADAGRSAGFLARQRITMSATDGGKSGRN